MMPKAYQTYYSTTRCVTVSEFPLMLHTGYNQINAKAVAKLSTANWPLLEYLDLSGYPMENTALTCLVKTKWPLKELHLKSNDFYGDAVYIVIKGDWPLLEVLDLSYNDLHSTGATGLVQGKWPRLRILGFHRTQLKAKLLKILLEGQWPLLESCDPSGNRLGTVAYQLVGITDESGPAVNTDWVQAKNWPMLRTIDPHGQGFLPYQGFEDHDRDERMEYESDLQGDGDDWVFDDY